MSLIVDQPLPLIKPMLAVPATPFSHRDYLFEIKWDGYRCLAYLDRRTALVSRNLKNITDTFPDLWNLNQSVNHRPVILDGEIIVLNQGKPSFDALQSRARLTDPGRVKRAAESLPAIYMVFDILHYRGQQLVDRPLYERQKILRETMRAGGNILISEPVREDGILFYESCVEKGLEGVVAKKIDSRYMPGTRSPLWKKIRSVREADLVICGYRSGQGSRMLGALILGAYSGREFTYQGMVGCGFSRDEEHQLLKRLSGLKSASPTLSKPPAPGRSIEWVRPELVCRVQYLTLTREGILRHPVYKGLRSDKEPGACSPAADQ